jgi:threonylcarbamoyladenosine tRNA methylthiotransferase MtaB
MKYSMITLGCKVNEYESQFYQEQLENAGFSAAAENETADVVIINTCTVTNTAAAKSRQKIRRVKRDNPDAICAVVGCYAQTMEPEIRKSIEADLLVGATGKDKVVEQLLEIYKERHGDLPKKEEGQKRSLVEDSLKDIDFESMPIGHFEHQHRAFLKIQDGCNQYCAYCQIPFARGPERSQTVDAVIETAKQLAQKGHLEIVLTGIHTGRYKFRGCTLSELLKKLLESTPEEVCYRISSIEITEVTDELLDLMAANPRLLPHLHIPIQAGCNETLARMKRPYSVEQFEERMHIIRKKVPQISVSTDVITGFVQESEQEFETTVKNLEKIGFSFLHVFPFSRRSGTAADKMTGFVDSSIAKQRVKVLLDLSAKLRRRDQERFKNVQVLIERKDASDENRYTGYTAQYQPAKVISSKPLSGRIRGIVTGIEKEALLVQPVSGEDDETF